MIAPSDANSADPRSDTTGTAIAAGLMTLLALAGIVLVGFMPLLSLIALGLTTLVAFVTAVASHRQPPFTVWLRAASAALGALLVGAIAFGVWYAHEMSSFTF